MTRRKTFLADVCFGTLKRGGGIKEFLFLSSSDGSNCYEEEKEKRIGFSFSLLLYTTVMESHKTVTFPNLMFWITHHFNHFSKLERTHVSYKSGRIPPSGAKENSRLNNWAEKRGEGALWNPIHSAFLPFLPPKISSESKRKGIFGHAEEEK